MRIYNQKWTVKKILTSLPATILYFTVFCIFVYWNLKIIPVWMTMNDRVGKAQEDLQKVKDKNGRKQELNDNLKTDEGKRRYEKEFFNELDENEKLIILYSQQASNTSVEENLRKMTWYETKKQDFLVWVHNLSW